MVTGKSWDRTRDLSAAIANVPERKKSHRSHRNIFGLARSRKGPVCILTWTAWNDHQLRFSGVDVRGSDRTLTGEIQKYKVDDISTPCEWEIAVHFVVKDKAGATLYDAVKSATPTNDQHRVNFLEMKVVIEALIADPKFIKAIN